MKKVQYKDSEFGTVILSIHPTARHFIFKIRNNLLQITVPDGISYTQIAEVINNNREKIRKIYTKKEDKVLCSGTLLETRTLSIVIQTHKRKCFLSKIENHTFYIFCPDETDFKSPEIQEIITTKIKHVIKREAEKYLPQRLETLSRQLNLHYNQVSVSHGRKRLGRCDTRRNILLSYHLMFLPERLIDYVIYHELAHLTEMNHGKHFHQLCNAYCQGKAKILERELKAFPFPID